MILVLVGASGSGKTTQAVILEKRYNFKKIVTATTRSPRVGEIEGVNYFFIDRDKFLRELEDSNFLCPTTYSGNFYAIPKASIENAVNENSNIVLVLDAPGAKEIKEHFPSAIVVYLKLGKKILIERMKERGDSEFEIENRLSEVQDYESCSDFIIDADKKIDEVTEKILNLVEIQK